MEEGFTSLTHAVKHGGDGSGGGDGGGGGDGDGEGGSGGDGGYGGEGGGAGPRRIYTHCKLLASDLAFQT